MDKLSYSFGQAIASQLMDLGADMLNVETFSQAVKDVFEGNKLEVSPEDAQKIVTEFLNNQKVAQKADQAEKGIEAKKEGEIFLKKNAERANVITLASGLQYEILDEGTGKSPVVTDNVKCHYEGKFIDGTLFDSSIKRKEPAVFPLNGVIKGWTEGLQLMKEGGKCRFFIPYDLAYGSTGAGNAIPPYSALIFDVELIEIV